MLADDQHHPQAVGVVGVLGVVPARRIAVRLTHARVVRHIDHTPQEVTPISELRLVTATELPGAAGSQPSDVITSST